MPDPLSALSLASSIAQLVEFIKDVISDARHIAKHGSTSENEHIQAVVKDVGALSAQVLETYQLASTAPKKPTIGSFTKIQVALEKTRKEEVQALHDIGQASCEVSNELANILEGLQIHDSGNKLKRKRDALSTSFKTMLKKDDIQKLHTRLESLQRQLHLRLTYMMARSVHQNALHDTILRTLMFPAIHERHDAIPEAYEETFEWILDDETLGFKTWARTETGLFWITGKPGSGKSTLMKYLSNHRTTRSLLQSWAAGDKLVFAKHYFWYAGTAMQKSQAGLLRSILFQILLQCPEIAPLVAPRQRFRETGDMQSPWNMSELMDAMRRIAELDSLPIRFCVFVDGLDEYEGEHSEIVQLLSDLAKSPRLKMALSSRPWNVFVREYGQLPSKNKIIMQDLTREDILTYIEGNLLGDKNFRDLRIQGQGTTDLIEDITDRSEGVFLWVFLVVRSLLRGLTNGDDLEILHQRVAEYPDSLDGYFHRMFLSTENVYKKQMGRILLAAIHGEGSLPLRLVDDLQTETHNSDFDLWLSVQQHEPTPEEHEIDITRVKQLLDARCRDLLEVVNGRIAFLHRTVKDFLATRDLHSTLQDRAGIDFDPVVSLSKVTLATIKSDREERKKNYDEGKRHIALFDLVAYEKTTAQKKWWRSHAKFFEALEEHLQFWHNSRPRHDRTSTTLTVPVEGSSRSVQRFLHVADTQDRLVVVQEDQITRFGTTGCANFDLRLDILCHSWLGFQNHDALDRVLVISGYNAQGPKGSQIYAFVARFRDKEDGTYERQRAFIRLIQAFFAQEGTHAAMAAIIQPIQAHERDTLSKYSRGNSKVGIEQDRSQSFHCTNSPGLKQSDAA